ncbi:MAG: hypothetical protein R3D63_14090 [Paracoccaceae bacterium]
MNRFATSLAVSALALPLALPALAGGSPSPWPNPSWQSRSP